MKWLALGTNDKRLPRKLKKKLKRNYILKKSNYHRNGNNKWSEFIKGGSIWR